MAAGAGAVIALASDLRVVSERARFAFLFAKVGLAGVDMGSGYLLPGSSETITQRVPVESQASSEANDPWLSAESMAEHYAMYSMYLGLREATRQAEWSYQCAAAALDQLDRKADTWNQEAADEDIDADRALIARFRANLAALGAAPVGGDYAASCGDGGDGGYDGYGDDTVYRDGPYACSAAGNGGGWWILALVALVYLRRRRP